MNTTVINNKTHRVIPLNTHENVGTTNVVSCEDGVVYVVRKSTLLPYSKNNYVVHEDVVSIVKMVVTVFSACATAVLIRWFI
jgi:hypothetical protein